MGNGVARPLRLAVYGFDDRSRETLRLAFDGPGKGCGVIVDESAAEASIFNMDSVNASELWRDYRQRFPDRSTIIMAIKDPQIEGTVYIPKPVRIDAMMKAIEKVRGAAIPTEIAETTEQEAQPEPVVATQVAGGAVVHSAETAANTDSAAKSPARPVKQVSDKGEPKNEPAAMEPAARKEKVGEDVSVKQRADTATKPAATAPKPAKPKPVKRRETYYDPLELLQGKIQEALDHANKKYVAVQLNVQVDEGDWQSITFLPGVKRVLTTLSEEQLKHLCTTPVDLLNCKTKIHKGDETFNMIRKVTDEKSGQSLDVFLWKVAVWSSVGRLPAGTNLSEPVKLKHWPNLTRFYPIPNAMRIATLIIDQPRPLPLVIKVLNLPQSHVFAFYSAANAIGLVANREGVGESSVAEQVTPQKHKHHSLFGRILKRLRGSGGA